MIHLLSTFLLVPAIPPSDKFFCLINPHINHPVCEIPMYFIANITHVTVA